jgi:hypothetical protein
MSDDKTILNQLRRARDQRDIAMRELEFAKRTRQRDIAMRELEFAKRTRQRDIAMSELEFAKRTRWLWLTIGFVIGGIFF